MHKQVKLLSSAKSNFMYLPSNYRNNAGMTEFTEFNVKQVANRPAHLPRVQAPVHIYMLKVEFLEFTIKGDPRT